MTLGEARQILLRARSEGADASDHELVEARRMAESNPELREWLASQQAFNVSIRAALKSVQLPADLKARILTGKPAFESAALSPSESAPALKTIPFRRLVAIAAALVLLMSLAAALWLQAPPDERTFANFRSRMTAFALRTYKMDILSEDGAAVRQFLRARGAPSDFPLTPGLAKLPVKGGGRLTWQNQPVAMICFDLPSKETLFMFVIDEASVPDPQAAASGRPEAAKGLPNASWIENGRIILIAANTDASTLDSLARR